MDTDSKTLTEKEKSSLLWIVDPGHAWLRVPYRLCGGLDISEFSFYDEEQKVAWLEEDCDAFLFIEAYDVNTSDIKTSNRITDWNERYSLPRFSPAA